MRLISKILVRFGVAFIVVAAVYGLVSKDYGGVAFLTGTGLASLFVAAVIRVSPVLEFMRATPESGIERLGPERPGGAGSAGPERPGRPGRPDTEPSGAHLPGPSAAPIFLALGAALVAAGIAFDADIWIFLILGGVVLLGALLGWAVQAWNESERSGGEAGEAPDGRTQAESASRQ